MKKLFQVLAIATASLLASSAQSFAATDISGWSFGNTDYYDSSTGAELRYRIGTDSNNDGKKIAKLMYADYNHEWPETVVVPENITVNGESYEVVATEGYNYGSSNTVTKSITLPNTLIKIGDYSFYYFKALQDLNIPASVEIVGKNTFVYTADYVNIKMEGAVPETPNAIAQSSLKVWLTVPHEYFHDYLLAPNWRDFCVIDAEAEAIHTGPVDNGELGYVVVGDALPQVRTYSMVNELVVDEGTIDETDWHALREMKNLVKLDLSNVSIEDIPNGALQNCWQIREIILPATTINIGNSAFSYLCMKELILPESVRKLGSSVCNHCEFLEGIIIPEGVKAINSYAFQSCYALKSASLPSTLETLNSYAFNNSGLLSIDIPGGVKEIGSYAFYDCDSLASVKFNDGTEIVRAYAFQSCNTLSDIHFCSTMKSLKDYSFSGDQSLAVLNLNEGMEELSYYCFYNCDALTDVVLPSSLRVIYGAFYECDNVTRIEARSIIPPSTNDYDPLTGSNFSNKLVELWVPEWSVQEYMTAFNWLYYQDYLHIIPDYLPENIVIRKDFEFMLKTNNTGYTPNIALINNDMRIDDGFGDTKYERGNLIISSRSKLDVNQFKMAYSPYAKYYLDNVRWYSTYHSYDQTSTMYNPNSLLVRREMRAEDVTIDLWLYNDRWQFVSFPFDVQVSDIVPMEREEGETQWAIRAYDGQARAERRFDDTWVALSGTDILEAGKGYAMRCYAGDYSSTSYRVGFTVKPVVESVNRQKIFDPSDRLMVLDECLPELDENSKEYQQNRSWNLIGNPYPTYYDSRFMSMGVPFMIWDSYHRRYQAVTGEDDQYVLSPGEAFFIQAPADDQNLTFLNAGRQIYVNPNDLTVYDPAPQLRVGAKSERLVYNLLLSNGDDQERTRVVLNESADLNYEIGRDAAKFEEAEEGTSLMWTADGDVHYAINERPLADGRVELSLYCGADGLYTLSLGDRSAQGSVILYDRKNNTEYELQGAEGYTFSASKGRVENRFELLFNVGMQTGIAGIENESSEAPAYNMMGQRVDAAASGIFVKNGHKIINK